MLITLVGTQGNTNGISNTLLSEISGNPCFTKPFPKHFKTSKKALDYVQIVRYYISKNNVQNVRKTNCT